MPSTRASVVSTSSAPRAGLMTAASSPGPTTTHGGMARRDVILAMIARSPREETVECRKNEKAPLCRVGRSNEPAKAGGAAVIGRASGFLGSEACTTPDPAAHLDGTLAQTSLRKPSRAKQELRDLSVRGDEGQGDEP